MKKKIYIKKALPMLCAVALGSALASCSLETEDAGNLGGMWHMVSVDTLATGGVKDVSAEGRFWSVQGKILEVSTRSAALTEYIIFRYEHNGDSLRLYDCRLNDREKSDSVVTDVEKLRPYGINNTQERFYIDALNGGKMTLKSGRLRLNFKKF